MIYLAVVGGSKCSAEESRLAYEVGAVIARKGGTVICGGGLGVMEAASRGAKEAGGMVFGILPGDSPHEGNSHLTAAIATGLGEARNAIIARTVDAVIAVGGEYGTLSEIALALKMNKPVIGLRSWQLTPPIPLKTLMLVAATSAEAVDLAFSSIRG
ncbi:MAG: TIGR00725 family protein [Bacillota bacterium]|nr:TIGR00725 family protein [Bacillota bacterium]MDW7728679.1 TIGR00725 family protein [Bacillota bacterium]